MGTAPWRIRDRATFEQLRRSPTRLRRGPITMVMADDASPRPRVAFAIGRQVGGAVVRNRVRRRLRAAAAAAELAPGAYLLIASPAADAATAAELGDAVRSAAAGLATRRATA